MASSGGQAIGTALTGGIQDISALLPLLGTEQCEDNLASALTNGYLYAAATPLSIFGSLGAARAGFKTLLSATSIRRFVGARILADAGFKPEGENLSLIMLEEDRKSYCAERRLASMMTDPRLIHVKQTNKISVSSMSWTWNIQMAIATAVSCIVSITPYIHLNLNSTNNLDPFVRWAFPVMRAIGGFLTATMTQLVIQMRVRSIMRKRLILDILDKQDLQDLDIDETDNESPWIRFPTLDQRSSLLEQKLNSSSRGQRPQASSVSSFNETKGVPDLESAGWLNVTNESSIDRGIRLDDLQARIIQANGHSVLRGTFLLLLSIGIVASVVGYVGCFTVVQGSRSSTGPLIWLCLETGLSVIRIILWGLNPKCDDAPPLELIIELEKYAPLPTCTRTAEEIEETKTLPVVRAPKFLKAITSYAGVLTQFTGYPTIKLYYTLTRRNYATPESSKRVLYITVFDNTHRRTRVYSEDWDTTGSKQICFYSAAEVEPDVNGNLTTEIGERIQHQYDSIAGNEKLRIALSDHYCSILRQVNSGIRNHHPDHDIVESTWTLKLGEDKSKKQKFGEQESLKQTFGDSDTLGKFGGRGDRRDEKALENEPINIIKRDGIYIEQGRVEKKVHGVIRDRGEQIDDYMSWLRATIDDESSMMKMRHIEADKIPPLKEVEEMLMTELREMELMLVDEVHGWEEKLRVCRRGFLDGMDAEMGAKVERRWRTDLGERLKYGEQAMKARMTAAGSIFWKRATDAQMNEGLLKMIKETSEPVERAWRLLFTELYESAGKPSPSRRPSSRLKTVLKFYSGNAKGTRRWQDRMATRLGREVDDVEERLERGLEHCHEFRSSRGLVHLTHSHSKWLCVQSFDDDVIKALKRNKLETLIHLTITIGSFSDAEIIRFFDNIKSTSCTSIHFDYEVRIPDSVLHKLSPNILSITGSQPPLEALNAVLERNRSRLEESRKTTVEFANLTGLSWMSSLSVAESPPSFTIRFFGPESSDHLTLRVIHRCDAADACLTVELKGSLKPLTYPITPSDEFELQNITIANNRKHSGLTFEPGHRNTLTFIAPDRDTYYLRDVELLDKDGNRYNEEVISDSNQEENDTDSNLNDAHLYDL